MALITMLGIMTVDDTRSWAMHHSEVLAVSTHGIPAVFTIASWTIRALPTSWASREQHLRSSCPTRMLKVSPLASTSIWDTSGQFIQSAAARNGFSYVRSFGMDVSSHWNPLIGQHGTQSSSTLYIVLVT